MQLRAGTGRLLRRMMSCRAQEPVGDPKHKIVIVAGATAAGKSRLAVELCRKFNGEVISADSMQVYKGLDALTNKVTEAEAKGVPHHLIGFLDPLDVDFDVRAYRDHASKAIRDVRERGKLPVVAGGTHYYLNALLWNTLVGDEAVDEPDSNRPRDEPLGLVANITSEEQADIQAKLKQPDVESQVLYEYLKKVDPVASEKLHPNNERKIRRALEVYVNTGKPMSDILTHQHELLAPMYDVCILWVHVDKKVLNQRLDARVDTMIQNNLLDELNELWKLMKDNNIDVSEVSTTQGVVQAIGVKELRPLVIGTSTMEECLEKMKAHTRSYARKQLKWERILSKGLPVNKLDASDLSEWDSVVLGRASSIVEEFLRGSSQEHIPRVEEDTWRKYSCEVCGGRVLNGLHEYEIHLKSSSHRRTAKKLKRITALPTEAQKTQGKEDPPDV